MLNRDMDPAPYMVDAATIARQQHEMLQAQKAAQAALLGGYGASQTQAADLGAPKQRYRTTMIKIQETSNGQIISVGPIVRLCGRDDHLIDVIAAALAEYEIDSNS